MSKYTNKITQLTPDILREIGERVRERRVEVGMSVPFFADELGVSTSTVYKIQSGNTRMGIDEIYSIGRILKVSVDYLLYGEAVSVNNYLDPDGIFSRLDYKETKIMEAVAEMIHQKKAGEHQAFTWVLSHISDLTA